LEITKEQKMDMLYMMTLIRNFEETARVLFLDGIVPGFLHLYSGEEAIATGVCELLTDEDYITSTHRGHGHCLAKGADVNRMMAELFGKKTGYCKGKGGSMHIADISKGIIGANGIVGAGLPIACGAAFKQKYRGEKNVTVAFFGDGATNRGTFHEAMNMAAALQLPVVFVCENNNFGMSTPFNVASHNKTISQRGIAYDMPGYRCDGNDPIAVLETCAKPIQDARDGKGPSIVECLTWRHWGHFVGDPMIYKDPAEQEDWLTNKDPIKLFRARLLEEGTATQEEIDAVDARVKTEIDNAVAFAEESEYPSIDVIYEDLYFE